MSLENTTAAARRRFRPQKEGKKRNVCGKSEELEGELGIAVHVKSMKGEQFSP
jgi:hypothetical protein